MLLQLLSLGISFRILLYLTLPRNLAYNVEAPNRSDLEVGSGHAAFAHYSCLPIGQDRDRYSVKTGLRGIDVVNGACLELEL